MGRQQRPGGRMCCERSLGSGGSNAQTRPGQRSTVWSMPWGRGGLHRGEGPSGGLLVIWGSGVGAPGGEASVGRARRLRLGLLWDGRSPDTRLVLPATTAPILQSGARPHNATCASVPPPTFTYHAQRVSRAPSGHSEPLPHPHSRLLLSLSHICPPPPLLAPSPVSSPSPGPSPLSWTLAVAPSRLLPHPSSVHTPHAGRGSC